MSLCSTPLCSPQSHTLFSTPSKIPTFNQNFHFPKTPFKIPHKNPQKFRTIQLHSKRTKPQDLQDKFDKNYSNEDDNRMMIIEEEDLGGSGFGRVMSNLIELGVLISPFFFWGTAMVAMKEVLPKVGPFFVASFRLIPAGVLLIGFAVVKGRPLPSGFNAWFSILVFALVDASCFQGFLAEGLQRTSAGLGSVSLLSNTHI